MAQTFRSVTVALGYGVVLWAIVFAAAILISPLRADERPLFESIMPVVVGGTTAILAVSYMTKMKAGSLKAGLWIGGLWLAVSVLLDLPMFSAGPMKMEFVDYLKDIGLTYLLIPVITVALGSLARRKGSPPVQASSI